MLRSVVIGWLLLAACAVAGCDSETTCHASSVGACQSKHGSSCGIQLTCSDSVPRELRCTPPDSKLPMSCECIEGGSAKTKVQIDTKLPRDLAKAGGIAKTQCGWKLK
jgi:hypothetical protein